MRPIFVATGPDFKKNYIANTFNNTDIYILMCTLLGLEPGQHDGSFDNIKDLLVDNQTPIY
jgi:ectonucleotide pyrophosphatase/phosphodiesterase family protein 5